MTQAYQSNMTTAQAENLVDLKSVEGAIAAKIGELRQVTERLQGETKELGQAKAETLGHIEKLKGDYDLLFDRLQRVEQRGASMQAEAKQSEDIGTQFIKSEQWQAFAQGRQGRARMEFKTAIINATGQNQPLVEADRLPGIYALPNRVLSIRDILPASATNSNLIEYVRENTFTNNAGPQIAGSPQAFENVTKPESGITFTLVNTPVTTLAHYIPASKQVLDDSASLQSYINNRLMYGLKLYEETQLLTGTGSNGQLPGIYTNATAYTVRSPQLTNEIDIIRDMIRQAHVANYVPDAIIMHPTDWYSIDIRKVATSDDRYVVGDPRNMSVPRLWGLPVVITNSITAGTCLLGSFGMGAEIKDRQQAMVEVSRENSDNFVKNMVTILAEERIALCIYRTEAFIKATI